MTIPAGILREHVLAAIEEINETEVPVRRESTLYDLVFQDARLPPKYVLSIAAKHAGLGELPPTSFSGGDEANDFLRSLGFTIRAKRVDWSEAECYLAVWAYDLLDLDRETNKTALYRQLADLSGRTAKAFEYKIQNVSAVDPRPRSEKPISEAPNVQSLLKAVFEEYWRDRPSARAQYARRVQEIVFQGGDIPLPIESKRKAQAVPNDVWIEEGAEGYTASFRRGRSEQLLAEARRHFKSRDPSSKLRCDACGFAAPPGLNREIVQIHHKLPVSMAGADGRRLRLQEALTSLVPLCPTCHAIAHCESPPMESERIRLLRGP